ncbi:glycosyltransferase family 4 protein [Halobacteriaceae archaeon GCM10025711]
MSLSYQPEERLDVGFIPAGAPGHAGTGATQTSSLLIDALSDHHDLTVYVYTQEQVDESLLPGDDVEYVVEDGISKLPHPLTEKLSAVEDDLDRFEKHDLVHSYSSAFIGPLADLQTDTVVTLNSYVPVCPKGDFMWQGTEKCSGPGALKCGACLAGTALRRRQGVETELRSAYVSAGKYPMVSESLDRADDIDGYHVLSPHLKDDYVDLGLPEESLTVIPHFYDEAFLSLNGELGADVLDDPIDLLYVGGLKDIKGVHVLLAALPEITDRGFDVRLRVAGTGPYGNALRDLATDLGVDDRVDWLGYVDHDDLPELYDDADVFVYPGLLDEPFGRVMLEALASQTPILSSDVGSMDDIVGRGGVLFEPGNEFALAAAFEELVASYDRRYNAIPQQLRRFSPQVVTRDFLALYDSL